MMKKLLCLLLAACFCLGAWTCLAEESAAIECEGISGPYQWMEYELTVDAVTVAEKGGQLFTGATRGCRFVEDDNRILAQITEPMVEIRLLGGENGVAFSDLVKENVLQFVLRDASGEVIPLYCWNWWGIGYSDEKGFSANEVQEGFGLMYFLPDTAAAEGLMLTVESAAGEEPAG